MIEKGMNDGKATDRGLWKMKTITLTSADLGTG